MNFEKNNKVYWILHKESEYNSDYPRSESWTNDIYPFYEGISDTFESFVSLIRERIELEKPDAYVIVSDTDKPEYKRLLHRTFLSNNIIDISFDYDKGKVGKWIEWIFSDFGRNNVKGKEEIFFTSDSHFFHSNIIRYCDRPWNSGKDSKGNAIITGENVEKMNEDIISRWNSVVRKNDIVWHLGDFCLGPNQKQTIPDIVSRLNGRINLVMGNHDNHSLGFYYDSGFNRVYDRPVLWNGFFILSHAPIQWIRDGSVYANLHGHVHNQELYRHVTSNTYNCCVEVNDYRPVSFLEIRNRMEACDERKV